MQDAEIEMEDIDDDEEESESVEDIDSCDKNNPLAVTEYIDDLYTYYKKMEVKYLSLVTRKSSKFGLMFHIRR